MRLRDCRAVMVVVGLLGVGIGAAIGQRPDLKPVGRDWPMWCGSAGRNAVSTETEIPADWEVVLKRNIKWIAPLGTMTYGTPVVANHRVYVGTNNGGTFRPHSRGDRGCMLCLDAKDGKLLWQATHDKLPTGEVNDWPEAGIASNPYVDGDRVYYVSNRCELVCADVYGFHDNENDGTFDKERFTEKQDADFVWILDMIGELGVFPHVLAASSPVGAGDLVYVVTGNGLGEDYAEPSAKVPAPEAPSLIAVNKKTGKVVWQRNDPGTEILHGQWSSPAYGLIDGTAQVVFGGGDGRCYGYDATVGALLWKFNLNPKGAVWGRGGRGGTKLNIIATPVIHDNKVFLGGGNDPDGEGPGRLYAIDATARGDITDRGRLWFVGGRQFGRSVSTVAIADGLLYAADTSGVLYCLDFKTGRQHWKYDMGSGVWGSPLVVDGKVMLGNVDGELHVLKHSGQLQKLAVNQLGNSIYTAPVVADGTLYIATSRRVYAIGEAQRHGTD
ncbi:MAG: PQQ-binding-like beta-propeller repeat protein [Phycisphaerales bacterium]|nr:MAG: PQQ-binding-like beta-propeller repeat protein [Phycisphaerales bacterium]